TAQQRWPRPCLNSAASSRRCISCDTSMTGRSGDEYCFSSTGRNCATSSVGASITAIGAKSEALCVRAKRSSLGSSVWPSTPSSTGTLSTCRKPCANSARPGRRRCPPISLGSRRYLGVTSISSAATTSPCLTPSQTAASDRYANLIPNGTF
ncbi:hypothetical protein KXV85_005569, partial [Aspergillus fumigatus]